MTVLDFFSNWGSTTQIFKSWTTDIQIMVLEHQVKHNIFSRIVVILVDKIPVLLGHSETYINNTCFFEILNSAGTTPIGTRLFAPNSGIKRISLEINKLPTAQIINKIIRGYLINGENEESVLYRQSNFRKDSQVMTLREYALPGMNTVLNLYSKFKTRDLCNSMINECYHKSYKSERKLFRTVSA